MIEGRLEWPWVLGYATEHWPSPKKLEPLAQKMLQAILDVSVIVTQITDTSTSLFFLFHRPTEGKPHILEPLRNMLVANVFTL